MLKLDQLKKILLEENGGDKQLKEFVHDFYHILASANPNRVVNNRDLLSQHFDSFARLIVGNGVCTTAGFDPISNKLYIATNRNDHSKHRYQTYMTMALKQGSTNKNKILKLFLHYSINYGQIHKISAGEVSYTYDHTSKLMIPNPKEIKVTVISDIRQIVPDAKIKGDLTIRFTLSELTPGLLPNFPMIILPQDVENPEKFFQLDKSLDDPFVRATESLIKLLGLHAMTAKAEQNGMISNSIDLLKLRSDDFRYTVFINSITWEASRWFKKNINHENNIGIQEFNLFLENLNNDFIKYKDEHHLSQMSTSSVRSWLISYFRKIQNQEVYCPDYLISKAKFFIRAVTRYVSDIETLEDYVKKQAKIGGNKFINFLEEQSNPATKVEGLIILDELEDNVHAEMRLLWYILTNGAQVPYISTSMLCCSHCNLAMMGHDINVSGRHGKVYGNWLLSHRFKHEVFLKKFLGEKLYIKFDKLKTENLTFEGKTYTKAEIALMLLQKISDISSSEEIRQALGITDPSIFNSDSNYADDLSGEDITSTNNVVVNRQEVVDAARLNYQMGLLSEPRIYIPIGCRYIEPTQQEQSNSDTVFSCHTIQYSNPLLNHPQLPIMLKIIHQKVGPSGLAKFIELGLDETKYSQFIQNLDAHGIEKSVNLVLNEDNNSLELEIIARIESIIGKEALSEIAGCHQYISTALSNNPLSSSATKVIQIIGNLVNNLEEWLDFGIAYESDDIDTQVTIMLTQLEHWMDFVASGTTHVGLPPRYPDFDPDDYYDGGSSGGGRDDAINNGNNDDLATDLVIALGGQNVTIYDT